jgi:hypothetical protein
MKLMTRYISLLFICGLMFSFHHNYTYIIGSTCKAPSYLAKTQPVKEGSACKLSENGFSFFKDVVANILPVLKSLN